MLEYIDRIITIGPFFLFIIGIIFFIVSLLNKYRSDTKIKISKAQIFDFIILVLRWYLGYYMLKYGFSKLIDGQFVRSEEILNTPLKDIDKFNLAWYLFSLDKTFNIIVGLSQIITALLIIYNRTVILGVIMLIPILAQIFLVDVSYSTEMFGSALPLRLIGMLISTLLILSYYKDRVIKIWNLITKNTSTKFSYKWWVFIILPFLGLLSDLVMKLITLPLELLINYFNR